MARPWVVEQLAVQGLAGNIWVNRHPVISEQGGFGVPSLTAAWVCSLDAGGHAGSLGAAGGSIATEAHPLLIPSRRDLRGLFSAVGFVLSLRVFSWRL